ncbi:MAG: EutN/CcmL family microcompartment protein [Candidatus Krumholzibacteriia bacterium]
MKVCRVVGEVVATVKHPALAGRKLLVVQPVDAGDAPCGAPLIAVDLADAGPGERVLLCDEGGSAALVLGRDGPVRAVIVGRVDAMGDGGSSSDSGF